ncbi:MAG TPA: hypothetical protein VF727_06280 [Allosphingosinicella sp.]
MQPLINDATTALLRAIRSAFENFGGFALEEIRSRSWASITFSGARHELAFRLEGEGAELAAERFLARLNAAEFRLRGHLLADIAVLQEERRRDWARIRLEALTVEDG